MAKLPVKAPEGFVLDEPNVPEGFVLDGPIIAPETADPQSIQGVRDTSLDKYVDEMISTAGQAGISLEEADRIGKLGLFEDVKGGIGFWEAAKQDWKTKIPFSPAGAVETLNILSTASRLHRDDFDYSEYADTMATYPYSVYWKPLTAEQYEQRDIKTITNYMEKMAERELRGYTGMGKFGAAASVVPAWMIEFAATGGLKKLGSEPAKKFLAKRLRSRLAGRLGGWVAGAAVRTTLGMPHRTVEATLRRRLTGDPENWASSISLGWGEVFIEALSEEAGGAMVRGAKGAGVGLVSKLPFGKKFIGALQVAWMDKTKGTAAQFAKRIFTKGGYHGIVGEIGEERLATLLHGLVGTEEFGAGQEAGPLARIIAGFKQDWENKYIELGVFGTIGGGQLALGKATGLVAPKDVSRLEEIVTRFNEQIEAAEKRGDTEMVKSLRLQEALEIEGVVAPAGAVPELPEVKEDELEVPEEAAPAEPTIEEPSPEELDRLISAREDQILLEQGSDELLRVQHRASEEQLTDLEYLHRLRSIKLKGEAKAPAEAIKTEPVTPAAAEPTTVAEAVTEKKTDAELALDPMETSRVAMAEAEINKRLAEGDTFGARIVIENIRDTAFRYGKTPTARGLNAAADRLEKIVEPAAPTPVEPVTPVEAKPVKEDWQKAIETSLVAAKKLKPIVAEEKTTELGKRVGKMVATMTGLREKGVRPEQAIAKSTAALRGELTEYDLRFEPIRDKLSDEVIDSAFDSILESRRLRPLDKENTRKALSKLLDGSYLRLFESDLITDHFGMDMGKEARRRVPFGDSWTRTLAEYIGIPRTSLTALSGDMSGIMRQARPLGQVYPKEFGDFVVKSVKAWGSEKAFRKMEEESLALPFVDEAATDGILEGTRYGEAVGEPMERGEEFIGAGPLEKIPIIKYPIKAAERAFTVLNIFRRAVYSRIRTEATRTGVDTMSVADRKRIASIINDMSGRAHVKRTKAAKAILPYLQALFAPRFRIARVRAPFRLPIEVARFGRRLVTGERLNLPELRMTAGAFASTIATNLLIMYLVRSAYLAWGGDPDDVEMESDLRATDGGKLRIKDMHVDLWMGYLQDFQTYMQLATGQAKSQAGELYDINRVDVLKRAIRKRTRPFVSLAVDALTGETVTGKRFGAPPKGKEGKVLESWEVPEWLQGVGLETWNRIVPLVTQDAVDALIIEGVPESITMGVLSHFGISVATYEKWAASELKVFKNQLAMQKHGKKWDKLRPDQQEKFAPQLIQLELLARQERPLRPRSKFVSKEEEAQKERMFKAMSPPVKKILEDAGMDVGGISRFNILGLDKLDDKRFEFYEKRAIKHLETELKQLSRKKGWSRRPIPDRVDEIKKASNKAKEKARRDLDKEMLRGNI